MVRDPGPEDRGARIGKLGWLETFLLALCYLTRSRARRPASWQCARQRLCTTSEALIYAAMGYLILRRLAETEIFSDNFSFLAGRLVD